MESRSDVHDQLKKTKKRLEEAESVLRYLERAEAPKTQISAMKRVVGHLKGQFNLEKLAFALADLQSTGTVRPEGEEENAFTV